MKCCAALLAACLITTASLADTPQETFDHLSAQAADLAKQKSYDAAAAVLEKMGADPTLTGQTEWPDRLYDLARDYALMGQTDKALATLERATLLGAVVTADDVAKQADFASLRDTARFKAVVETLTKRARLWQDNPALATPYKPVLSSAEKAAGVSKLWSEARFNFVFFDRIPDLDWDAAYMKALDEAEAAKTTEEYYRVLSRFLSVLRDGHTRVIVPSESFDTFYGVAPLRTRLIENKIVVTDLSDDALKAKGVTPGDELIAINGTPTREYAAREREPYVFGFSPQERAAWLYEIELLRGPVDQPLTLTFKTAAGKTVTASVARRKADGFWGFFPDKMGRGSFRMLPNNIAYLEIGEFVTDVGIRTLRENFAAISASKGLIIDIRHNPGGDDRNAMAIMKVLADKPFPGSIWRSRNYRAAFRSWNKAQGWFRGGPGSYQPDDKYHYSGPVAVLTDSRT